MLEFPVVSDWSQTVHILVSQSVPLPMFHFFIFTGEYFLQTLLLFFFLNYENIQDSTCGLLLRAQCHLPAHKCSLHVILAHYYRTGWGNDPSLPDLLLREPTITKTGRSFAVTLIETCSVVVVTIEYFLLSRGNRSYPKLSLQSIMCEISHRDPNFRSHGQIFKVMTNLSL